MKGEFLRSPAVRDLFVATAAAPAREMRAALEGLLRDFVTQRYPHLLNNDNNNNNNNNGNGNSSGNANANANANASPQVVAPVQQAHEQQAAAATAAASAVTARKVNQWLKSALFRGGLQQVHATYSTSVRRLAREIGVSTNALPGGVAAVALSTDEQAFLSALMDGPGAGAASAAATVPASAASAAAPKRASSTSTSTSTSMAAAVAALARRLDTYVPPHVRDLQKSLQELAQTLVCALFAVYLKHGAAGSGTSLVRMALQAAQAAANDPTNAAATAVPDRVLQKLWIRASAIKSLLRDKKANGEDFELFATHVLAKMELLLSLASPMTDIGPSAALIGPNNNGSGSGSSGGVGPLKSPDAVVRSLGPASKWRRARRLLSHVLRAVNALDSAAKRLALSKASAHNSWTTAAAQMSQWHDFDLVGAVTSFVSDESVDALSVRDALVAQRDRALLRLFALQQLRATLGCVTRAAHAAPLFVHLADALRGVDQYSGSTCNVVAGSGKNNSNSPDAGASASPSSAVAVERVHFLDQLTAVGPAHTRALSDEYYGLALSLVRSAASANARTVALRAGAGSNASGNSDTSDAWQWQSAALSLCTIDLSAADLAQLSVADAITNSSGSSGSSGGLSITSFIAPLISLCGVQLPAQPRIDHLLPDPFAGNNNHNNNNNGKASSAASLPGAPDVPPFAVRYAAYCLFRAMAYAYANEPDAAAADAAVDVLPPPQEQKTTAAATGAIVTDSSKTTSSGSGGGLRPLRNALLTALWDALQTVTALQADLHRAKTDPTRAHLLKESSTYTASRAHLPAAQLLTADHAWFDALQRIEARAHSGVRASPSVLHVPNATELDLYANQILWVVLRCCSAGPATAGNSNSNNNSPLRRCLAADPKWVSYLLRGAGIAEPGAAPLSATTPAAASTSETKTRDTIGPQPAGAVPDDSSSGGSGGVSPSESLTRVLCTSILAHVLPCVDVTATAEDAAYAEALCARLLDAIGASVTPAQLAKRSAAPRLAPRSELVFLYRTLLDGSKAAHTAAAAALSLSRSTSTASDSKPTSVSRQSSYDEKKSGDTKTDAPTAAAAAPAPVAAPALVRIGSDYRAGLAASKAAAASVVEQADRVRRQAWGAAADAALAHALGTLGVLHVLLEQAAVPAGRPRAAQALVEAQAELARAQSSRSAAPTAAAAAVAAGAIDTAFAKVERAKQALDGLDELSALCGSDVSGQVSRVFGAVSVCGGHLEHLRAGGTVDVSVSGRGDLLATVMKLDDTLPSLDMVVRAGAAAAGGGGADGGGDIALVSIARAKAVDAVAFEPQSLADPTTALDELVTFLSHAAAASAPASQQQQPLLVGVVLAKLRRTVASAVRAFVSSPALSAHVSGHPTLLPLLSQLALAPPPTATGNHSSSRNAVSTVGSSATTVLLAESEARVLQLEGNTPGYDAEHKQQAMQQAMLQFHNNNNNSSNNSSSSAANSGLDPIVAGGLAAQWNRLSGMSGSGVGSGSNSGPFVAELKQDDCVLAPAGPWAPVVCSGPEAAANLFNTASDTARHPRTLRRVRPLPALASGPGAGAADWVTMAAKVLVQQPGHYYFELHFLNTHDPGRTAVGWARPDRWRLDSQVGRAGSWGFDPVRQDKVHDGSRVSYGEFYARGEREVVGCLLQLERGRAQMSFALSGKVYGTAFQVDVPPLGQPPLHFGYPGSAPPQPYIGFVPAVSTTDPDGVRLVFADDELRYLRSVRFATGANYVPLYTTDESLAVGGAAAVRAGLAAQAALQNQAAGAGSGGAGGSDGDVPRPLVIPYPYALWSKKLMPSASASPPAPGATQQLAPCQDIIHRVAATVAHAPDGKEWTSIDTVGAVASDQLTAADDDAADADSLLPNNSNSKPVASSSPSALSAALFALTPEAKAAATPTAMALAGLADPRDHAAFTVAFEVQAGSDMAARAGSGGGRALAPVLAFGRWPGGDDANDASVAFRLNAGADLKDWTLTVRTPTPAVAAAAASATASATASSAASSSASATAAAAAVVTPAPALFGTDAPVPPSPFGTASSSADIKSAASFGSGGFGGGSFGAADTTAAPNASAAPVAAGADDSALQLFGAPSSAGLVTSTFTPAAFAAEAATLARLVADAQDGPAEATAAKANDACEFDFRGADLPQGARVSSGGVGLGSSGGCVSVAAGAFLELNLAGKLGFPKLTQPQPPLQAQAQAASAGASPSSSQSTLSSFTVHAVIKVLALPPASSHVPAALVQLSGNNSESAVAFVTSTGALVMSVFHNTSAKQQQQPQQSVNTGVLGRGRVVPDTWHTVSLVVHVPSAADRKDADVVDPNSLGAAAATTEATTTPPTAGLYLDGELVYVAPRSELDTSLALSTRYVLKPQLLLFASAEDPRRVMRGGCVQAVRVERGAASPVQVLAYAERHRASSSLPVHQIVVTGALEPVGGELKHDGPSQPPQQPPQQQQQWRLAVHIDGTIAHTTTVPLPNNLNKTHNNNALLVWPPRVRCQAPYGGSVRNLALWRVALDADHLALLRTTSGFHGAASSAAGNASAAQGTQRDEKASVGFRDPFADVKAGALNPFESKSAAGGAHDDAQSLAADLPLLARLQSERSAEHADELNAHAHKLSGLLRSKHHTLMALRLQGGGGHAVVRHLPQGMPTGNSSYTLECWVRAESHDKSFGLIAWGGWGRDYACNGLVCNNTCLVNLWWSKNINKPIELLNEWHHVAVTYDAASNPPHRALYYDGAQVVSEDITDGVQCRSEANDFFLGRYLENDGDRTLRGHLTELRVWNTARTAKEIHSAMYRPIGRDEAHARGLVAYYSASQRSPADVAAATAAAADVASAAERKSNALVLPPYPKIPPPPKRAASLGAPGGSGSGASAAVPTGMDTSPRTHFYDAYGSAHADLVGNASVVNLTALGVLNSTPVPSVAATAPCAQTPCVALLERARKQLAPSMRAVGAAPEWVDLALEQLLVRERVDTRRRHVRLAQLRAVAVEAKAKADAASAAAAAVDPTGAFTFNPSAAASGTAASSSAPSNDPFGSLFGSGASPLADLPNPFAAPAGAAAGGSSGSRTGDSSAAAAAGVFGSAAIEFDAIAATEALAAAEAADDLGEPSALRKYLDSGVVTLALRAELSQFVQVNRAELSANWAVRRAVLELLPFVHGTAGTAGLHHAAGGAAGSSFSACLDVLASHGLDVPRTVATLLSLAPPNPPPVTSASASAGAYTALRRRVAAVVAGMGIDERTGPPRPALHAFKPKSQHAPVPGPDGNALPHAHWRVYDSPGDLRAGPAAAVLADPTSSGGSGGGGTAAGVSASSLALARRGVALPPPSENKVYYGAAEPFAAAVCLAELRLAGQYARQCVLAALRLAAADAARVLVPTTTGSNSGEAKVELLSDTKADSKSDAKSQPATAAAAAAPALTMFGPPRTAAAPTTVGPAARSVRVLQQLNAGLNGSGSGSGSSSGSGNGAQQFLSQFVRAVLSAGDAVDTAALRSALEQLMSAEAEHWEARMAVADGASMTGDAHRVLHVSTALVSEISLQLLTLSRTEASGARAAVFHGALELAVWLLALVMDVLQARTQPVLLSAGAANKAKQPQQQQQRLQQQQQQQASKDKQQQALTRVLLPPPLVALCFHVLLRTGLLEQSERAQVWLRILGRLVQLPGVEFDHATAVAAPQPPAYLAVAAPVPAAPAPAAAATPGRDLYSLLQKAFAGLGGGASASDVAEKGDPVLRALLELQISLNKRKPDPEQLALLTSPKSGSDAANDSKNSKPPKEKEVYVEQFVVPATDFAAFGNNYPFLSCSLSAASAQGGVWVVRNGGGLRVNRSCSIVLTEPLLVDSQVDVDVVVECDVGCSMHMRDGQEPTPSWTVGLKVGPNTVLVTPSRRHSAVLSATGDGTQGNDQRSASAESAWTMRDDAWYRLSVHWSRATGVSTATFRALGHGGAPAQLVWRTRTGQGVVKNGALIEPNAVGVVVDTKVDPSTPEAHYKHLRTAWFRNLVVKQQQKQPQFADVAMDDAGADPLTVLLRKLTEFDELCTFFRATPTHAAAQALVAALDSQQQQQRQQQQQQSSRSAFDAKDAKSAAAAATSNTNVSAVLAVAPTLSERVVRTICKELGGVMGMSRDDFLRSVAPGSYASDLELVDCFNVLHARNDTSDTAFENQASRYKHLPQLSRLVWRHRLAVLMYFNRLLPGVLPFADLSADAPVAAAAAAPNAGGAGGMGPGSWLVRQLHGVRGLIMSQPKMAEWTRALAATVHNGREPHIEFNMFQASNLFEKKKTDFKLRYSLFGQLFQHLAGRPARERAQLFRVTRNSRAWKCQLRGLNAQDAGGPYRDVLERMARELQSPVLPLFVPCANQRSNAGENRDKFVPRPLPADARDRTLLLQGFELVGELMGLALRSGTLLALNLPSLVWKHLCSDDLTLDDVRAVDVGAFQLVGDLEAHLAQAAAVHAQALAQGASAAQASKASNDAFDSALARSGAPDTRFEAYGADQRVYPLVPGGSGVRVTVHNARAFITALTRFRVSEFRVACEAMRRGLATVVPVALLRLWSWQELERGVCGMGYDLDLLQHTLTVYDGCRASDAHIQLFWRMLRDRFSDADRAQFFTFVWGRSRLPTSREAWGDQKFKLSSYHPKGSGAYGRDINRHLPIAHTCFFHLEVPAYTSLDVMTERMTYAMQHSDVIDGDSAHDHGVVRTDTGADDAPSLWTTAGAAGGAGAAAAAAGAGAGARGVAAR